MITEETLWVVAYECANYSASNRYGTYTVYRPVYMESMPYSTAFAISMGGYAQATQALNDAFQRAWAILSVSNSGSVSIFAETPTGLQTLAGSVQKTSQPAPAQAPFSVQPTLPTRIGEDDDGDEEQADDSGTKPYWDF